MASTGQKCQKNRYNHAQRFRALRSVLCVGLVGGKTDAKPVLYEGGISRTTLSSKHVKRKRKNERGEILKT